MQAKAVQLGNAGMQQDTSISKVKDNFAFENVNIRITQDDKNAQLTVTNEACPKAITCWTKTLSKRYKGVWAEMVLTSGPPQTESYRYEIDLEKPVDEAVTIQLYEEGDTSSVEDITIGAGGTHATYTGASRNYKIYKTSTVIYTTDEYEIYERGDNYTPGTKKGGNVTPGGKITGTYVGSCQCRDYVVLFTVEEGNTNIYRVEYNQQEDRVYIIPLVLGCSLNMSADKIIDTLFYYESEDIQKVYWTDGIKSPRVINAASTAEYAADVTTAFEFYPEIKSLPNVTITKSYDYSGIFASGVIQYFITYYKKFGAETPIVYSSPLQYLSHKDRGAKADENVFCGMVINIANVPYEFDYVRIYSAQRTSQDGPILARIVADIAIEGETTEVRYVDLGTGETIDSNMLLYIGGQRIIAETLAAKDDTLFLGNITLPETVVSDEIRAFFKSIIVEVDGIKTSDILYFGDGKYIDAPVFDGYYAHTQQINNSQEVFGTFKRGEIYRFALQFMTKTGEWTAPVWIGDRECKESPYKAGSNQYRVPSVILDFSELPAAKRAVLGNLVRDKYIAYRLLRAETDNSTRRILAQGIVSGTLFNYQERVDNEPYSLPSWNFRLRGSELPYKHYDSIGCQYRSYAELQGVTKEKIPAYSVKLQQLHDHFKYYTLILGVDPGHQASATLIYFSLPEGANAESAIERLLTSNTKLKHYTQGMSTDWNNDGYYVADTITVNTTKWGTTMSKLYDKLVIAHKGNSDTRGLYPTIAPDATDTTELPFDRSALPTKDECKKILSTKVGANIWKAIASGLITAAAVVVSVYSAGLLAPFAAAIGAAGIAALSTSLGALALSVGILGAGAATKNITKAVRDATFDKADKVMARRGWFYVGKKSELYTNEGNGLYSVFENFEPNGNKVKFSGGAFWMTGGQLSSVKSYTDVDAEGKSEQFYVDNSIVTFNSPDFENVQDIIKNNSSIGLRIVGAIPIDAQYMSYSYIVNDGYSKSAGTTKHYQDNVALSNPVPHEFTNGFLYQDTDFKNAKSPVRDNYTGGLTGFNTYLWHRRYASSAGDHEEQIVSPITGTTEFGVIDRKLFANQLYASQTIYFDTPWEPTFGMATPQIYMGDGNTNTLTTDNYDFDLYSGRYNSVITYKTKYPIVTASGLDSDGMPITVEDGNFYDNDKMKVTDPVIIQLESTPHAVLRLSGSDNIKEILPKLSGETASTFESLYGSEDELRELFNSAKDYIIPWEGETTFSNDTSQDSPVYLMLASNKYDLFTIDWSETAFITQSYADDLHANMITEETVQVPYTDMEGEQTVTKYNTYKRITCKWDESDSYSSVTFAGYVLKAILEYFADEYPDAGFLPSVESQQTFLLACLKNNDCSFIFHLKFQHPTLGLFDRNVVLTAKAVGSLNAIVMSYSDEESTIDMITNYKYFGVPLYGWNTSILQTYTAILGKIFTDSSREHMYDDTLWSMYYVYPKLYSVVTKDSNVAYPATMGSVIKEDTIDQTINGSYLYVGELYKKTFDYSTLYGGTSESALERINWVVCSEAAEIKQDASESWYGEGLWNKAWGDTYFQRWDCLKSYPMAEGTQNGIVEILSCMLESHSNVDGRSDINRGIGNIISARPDNWNIMNPVYNQEDNLFQYNILDEKFSLSRFKNQIVWSTVKLPTSNIDTWTNINTLSSLFVDGTYGEIRKLLRVSNTMTFFQDGAIGVVNYNNRTQVSTESGQPLEVINSGKVNGYTYINTNSGTTIKDTIVQSGVGVIYTDTLNKAIKVFNSEGTADLGLVGGMAGWFKNNVSQLELGQYSEYDALTGDTYIHVNNEVIAYNERLKAFTSFYRGIEEIAEDDNLYAGYNTYRMFNLDSITLGYNTTNLNTQFFQMYAGTEYYPYSIQYMVNPNPVTDKVFTNIEYIADSVANTTTDSFIESDPFVYLTVWNEYQNTGRHSIGNTAMPDFLSPDKNRKFRIRRLQIPRASGHMLDRIRNPWCFVKLESSEEVQQALMTFHNIIIKYFE